MHNNQRLLIFGLAVLLFLSQDVCLGASGQDSPPVTDKVESILSRVVPRLRKESAEKGLRFGAPVFMRIFKVPAELEVWVGKNGKYELFKSYPICDYSGYPGPKLREGDWQSPEGFYTVSAEQMHPGSSYHLAFNIGYPNEYDMHLNRSGGNIMVHGDCSSMGCFAMNDYRMEEIYALAHAALSNGQQEFSVHIFPFRMTEAHMEKFSASPWIRFWTNIKEGYDVFEQTRQVPEITVVEGRYIIAAPIRLAMGQNNRQESIASPATPQNRQYK